MTAHFGLRSAWRIGLVLGWLLLPVLAGLCWTAAAPAEGGTAVLLDLHGAVGPAMADYVTRGISDGANRGARLVVLRMDTPGGLDSAMRRIIRAILASPVPVAAYVAPSGARAASAGTYITYACPIAAMAPGTNLGAATPVALGLGAAPAGGQNGQRQPSTEDRKITNDAAAYIRSLAELRGRNADWAEQAVRQAASLTAAEAVRMHVVDFLADNVDDLLNKADGRTVRVNGQDVTLATRGLHVVTIAPDWRTRFLGLIADPNLALIFMMVGVYGLIFEFLNPGMYLPGVAGAISLLIGLYAMAILPVSFAGIGLIVLGIALMIGEAFAPSGALAIGGVISLVGGAAILIDPNAAGYGIDWSLIAGLVAVSLGFSLIVLRVVLRARGRPVAIGHEDMMGLVGAVEDWTGAKGHVFVRGELWNATCPVPLTRGRRVRVTGISGLTLSVEPADA